MLVSSTGFFPSTKQITPAAGFTCILAYYRVVDSGPSRSSTNEIINFVLRDLADIVEYHWFSHERVELGLVFGLYPFLIKIPYLYTFLEICNTIR